MGGGAASYRVIIICLTLLGSLMVRDAHTAISTFFYSR